LKLEGQEKEKKQSEQRAFKRELQQRLLPIVMQVEARSFSSILPHLLSLLLLLLLSSIDSEAAATAFFVFCFFSSEFSLSFLT